MIYEPTRMIQDFAQRTDVNLKAIRALREQGEIPVYEVTQLVNSLLGLLVFPQQAFYAAIPRTPLVELERQGWPVPKVEGDFEQVSDLRQLLRYLRNAVAHFHIQFLADEHDQILGIRVWNMASKREFDPRLNREVGRPYRNWEATLSMHELEELLQHFVALILDWKKS